ncbi:hypothetical protein OIU77_005916 [Salix suchowensis]|uniref:Uncharacterized protein n=1 Tax=Salix suchowensis TaxID=1278906 RepID=A0ABQ9ATA4_9ROSI|nr:hypothetical protein OIU77_005916 [Salix suchowensis]
MIRPAALCRAVGHWRAGGGGEWETGIQCRGKEKKLTGRLGRVGVGRGGRVGGRIGFCRNHFLPRFRLWNCKGMPPPMQQSRMGHPSEHFSSGRSFCGVMKAGRSDEGSD